MANFIELKRIKQLLQQEAMGEHINHVLQLILVPVMEEAW